MLGHAGGMVRVFSRSQKSGLKLALWKHSASPWIFPSCSSTRQSPTSGQCKMDASLLLFVAKLETRKPFSGFGKTCTCHTPKNFTPAGILPMVTLAQSRLKSGLCVTLHLNTAPGPECPPDTSIKSWSVSCLACSPWCLSCRKDGDSMSHWDGSVFITSAKAPPRKITSKKGTAMSADANEDGRSANGTQNNACVSQTVTKHTIQALLLLYWPGLDKKSASLSSCLELLLQCTNSTNTIVFAR